MNESISFRYVAKLSMKERSQLFTKVYDLQSIEDTTDMIEKMAEDVAVCECQMHEGKNHCDCDSVFDYGDFEIIARDQSTGLEDKNNLPIFIGDILKQEVSDGEITAVVKWGNGGCYTYGLGELEGYPICFNEYYAKSSEIIGNIHQNPELITSKQ